MLAPSTLLLYVPQSFSVAPPGETTVNHNLNTTYKKLNTTDIGFLQLSHLCQFVLVNVFYNTSVFSANWKYGTATQQ